MRDPFICEIKRSALHLHSKNIAKALDVESLSINREIETEQCYDCNNLMKKLKKKLKKIKLDEQIQILTLVPESWTIEYTINYFDSTRYLVKKSRKLLTEEGVFK
jgi:hypothetical protein